MSRVGDIKAMFGGEKKGSRDGCEDVGVWRHMHYHMQSPSLPGECIQHPQ